MTEPDDGYCTATTGCKRHRLHGYLCGGHYERLGAILADLEQEAAILSAVPSLAQRVGSGGGTLASERAPARLDVLTLTDPRRGAGWSETDDDALAAGDTASILNTLHSWAHLIRKERGFATRAAITISGERDTLARHLEHAANQPWISGLYADLNRLLAQLRAANGTQPDRPVGRCYLPADTGPCDGPIWVDDAAGHAHCGHCQATWDGPQLAHLKWELDQARRPHTPDGRKMLTPSELATLHGVKRGTIFVWAHRRGIPSTDGHYDPAHFDKVNA